MGYGFWVVGFGVQVQCSDTRVQGFWFATWTWRAAAELWVEGDLARPETDMRRSSTCNEKEGSY